ncbi:MAG: hypothetical protein GOVbin1709_30 [Prokaryotic dsDNA virus sp.]|nr:MAG: hypothetical protein GOVbin1709_30 [Prokaryotic dsDNA virus sp.]|tara:strand:+ start:2819 stop:3019 length:201 start_codon:yes stop_codon:yes gene_type:complete
MDNSTTDSTVHGVVIVIDSTHKEAVLATAKSYFGKELTKEDLNKDGSYTMRLYVKEGYEVCKESNE